MNKQNILNENIVSLLGIEHLADEDKVILIEEMTNLVQKRVLLRILENLKEKDKKELEKITENKAKDETKLIFDFLGNKNPNLLAIIQEEIVALKEELTKEMKGLESDK